MKKNKINENKVRKRAKIITFLFLFASSLLVARTAYIQIVKGPQYSKEAMSQQYKTDILTPERGTIYDSNKNALALSIPKKDLWIEVSNLSESQKDYAAEQISSILEIEKGPLREKIFSDEKRFLVAKHLDHLDVVNIREAKIRGAWLEDSSKRIYPQGNFASYIIGHTSLDGEGLAGVESEYNDLLKGINGKRIILKDAQGRELKELSGSYIEPVNSKSVILSMDSKIQHHMEIAAEKALEANNAKRVTAIAMDPKTGDILGMTSKPDYDPNTPREPINEYFKEMISFAQTDEEKGKAVFQMWRNPAVNDVYEPGSPFKLITGAAAIEEGLTHKEEVFYDTGSIQVANRRIRNWRPQPFGSITFLKAMEQSVNTSFVIMGQRLGREKLYNYTSAFGFGEKTGIDLPGEGTGRIYPVSSMGPLELATTSFGQSISSTPLQVLTAVSAIANEGKVMKPRVVKAYFDEKTKEIEDIEPQIEKKAVSKETADIILHSMESVTENGSGKILNLPQYRIGTKTGTAQKVINGKYQRGFYVSSMVAVAPIEDPKIAIIVIVDEPRGVVAYGSSTSGPVVREVFENVLPYLGVVPNTLEEEKERINMPNVEGMIFSQAIERLRENDLSYIINNEIDLDDDIIMNAKVTASFPQRGDKIAKGSSAVLYLSYHNEKIGKIPMPDLKDMSLMDVHNLLSSVGIKFGHIGSGKVINQMPKPGEYIDISGYVSIELSEDFTEKEKEREDED